MNNDASAKHTRFRIRYRLDWLIVALVMVPLVACSSDQSDEIRSMRATISAQEQRLAQLSSEEEQVTGIDLTNEDPVANESTADHASGTPQDMVTIQLANEGLTDIVGEVQRMLIYKITNDNRFPVSVAFAVRFYDDTEAFLVEDEVVQCDFGELYTPSNSSVYASVISYQSESKPTSFREIDQSVTPGCMMDLSYLQSVISVPSLLKAYEAVQIAEIREVKSEETDADFGEVTMKVEGVLENTGDQDAEMTYIQAIGFDASEKPVFVTTLFPDKDKIPAGEKVNFSSEVYSYFRGIAPPFVPTIGDVSDIVSWEYRIASFALP